MVGVTSPALTPPSDDQPRLPAMRASDADRDEVAAVLSQALSDGRLTTAEHADRLEAAYNARTVAELTPLTEDLPAVAPGNAWPAAVERRVIAARCSKVTRRGRWVAARRTALRGMFGALIIDLSDAVLPGREIELDVRAFCAKVIVRLPERAQVVDDGAAVFSKRVVSAHNGDDAEAGPVLRVVGNAYFSKVIISRKGAAGLSWLWGFLD